MRDLKRTVRRVPLGNLTVVTSTLMLKILLSLWNFKTQIHFLMSMKILCVPLLKNGPVCLPTQSPFACEPRRAKIRSWVCMVSQVHPHDCLPGKELGLPCHFSDRTLPATALDTRPKMGPLRLRRSRVKERLSIANLSQGAKPCLAMMYCTIGM